MDADVREFLLTPTLALDDPMGVTKGPSVKRKPLKNKRSSSGFGASKKRGGYERKKSSSEGGENGGGAGIDGEEDDETSADTAAGSSAEAPAPPSAIESPPRDAPPANPGPVEHNSGERSTENNNG